MILRFLGVLITLLVSEVSGFCGNDDMRDAISLENALSLAVEKNPELNAYSWEIQSRQAGIKQMKALPNPNSDICILVSYRKEMIEIERWIGDSIDIDKET